MTQATTLHQAAARAFAEIEAATKDARNPHFKSTYADLSSVIAAIKPALVAHGLFFTQTPRTAEGGVCIETVLHHEGGEHMSLGLLFVPANKNDAQAYGSALTYARRYGLVAGFGVPTEDDDGNAAVQVPVKPEPAHEPITDDQRDLIIDLAPAAGRTVQELCGLYKIKSLKELSQSQAIKLIARLRSESKAAA